MLKNDDEGKKSWDDSWRNIAEERMDENQKGWDISDRKTSKERKDEDFLTGYNADARNFLENIRKWNSTFFFASFGTQTVQVQLCCILFFNIDMQIFKLKLFSEWKIQEINPVN